MRSILELPLVNTASLDAVVKLVNSLGAMLKEQQYALDENGTVICADKHVNQEVEQKLQTLNRLTGRVVNFRNYAYVWEHSGAKSVAMSLLQPKPPAVFDMTLEEVSEVVERVCRGGLEAHEVGYYLDLLQISLLLPYEAAVYLSGEVDGLPAGALPVEIAQKMLADGREASAILRI